MDKYRCYRCPHCGEQVTSTRGAGRGRRKTSFHTADGRTLHINDWAQELATTYQNIKYYLGKNWTMQQVFDRLSNPEYRKPGPKQGHNWKAAVKIEERK